MFIFVLLGTISRVITFRPIMFATYFQYQRFQSLEEAFSDAVFLLEYVLLSTHQENLASELIELPLELEYAD
jgi:hypothetical protein